MIRNMMGEMVEFDLKTARKLEKRIDPMMEQLIGLPVEFGEAFLSTWGYLAALDEIEYLRKQIKDLECRYNDDLRR